MSPNASAVMTSLAPWITIPSGTRALEFYKAAFGAIEVHRMEHPGGGLVVRLSVSGAEFWLSQEAPGDAPADSAPVGGGSVRMILTVPNPDEVFARALKAGATEVFPVGEDYGWRLGRLIDPIGLHWEIGYELPK